MSKKNTYEPTDVNYGGGDEYGANIHGVCIQVNQYVWDMIKILNTNNLYGFHFEAKLGKSKTIVILRHENQELLDKAKHLLRDSHEYPNTVFLTRLKKKKSSKTVWIILALVFSLALGSWLLYSLYEKKIIFNFDTSLSIPQNKSTTIDNEVHIEEVEIDIEKLKALKEIFDDSNNSIDASTMKMMEITTSIISSMVSEEEKAKYSSKNLVESFKGKSGIKYVLKDGNLSKDFNATVKELNDYATGFIKDNNISLALKCYDKIVTKDNRTVSTNDLVVAFANKAQLEEQLGEEGEAKDSYHKLLEVIHSTGSLKLKKYGLAEAITLSKLSTLYNDLNETQLSQKALVKSEEIYKNLMVELKKDGAVNDSQLGWSLNFLAEFYFNIKKDFHLSIEIRKEAINIYKKLAQKKPKKFALLYYQTLNSLGKTYLFNSQPNLAYKTYLEGESIIIKMFKSNSIRSKIYLALSSRALGKVEIVKKKFNSAKKYYDNALGIYIKLASKDKKYNEKIIEIEEALAYLDAKKGNKEIAIKRYKNVILSYSKMNKKEPLKYNFKISKVLNALASVHIKSKNYIEAEIVLFRAISSTKKIITLSYKDSKKLLAESYASLGYIAMIEGNKQGALEYYKKSISFKDSN